MNKDAGKGDTPRPCLVSEEERLVRWKYAQGEYPDMSERQFKIMVNKIRESTGKP
jgi:hypothetical protein